MYLEAPSIDNILTAIANFDIHSDSVLLLLVGEAVQMDIDKLIEQLSNAGHRFIGAIFPAVISEKTHSAEGVILKLLPAATAPYLIQNLDTRITLPDFEDELTFSEENQMTAIVWIDGLTSQISNFLAELYSSLGNSVRYLGGGAGSLSLQQKPCIFNETGCFQDAALIFFTSLESQLGVQHGWQRLDGPFPATRTHRNTIAELSWRSAFEVYRDVVESDCQQSISPENFFELAKGYPFGIFKEGQEDIVRDPIIANEDGELICVGEVPENALLFILRGDPKSLVKSAKTAAEEAVQNSLTSPLDFLVVDCISRVLFLGEQFTDELTAIEASLSRITRLANVEGVLTLGEISSYGDGFLEFFNKTIVVGALYQSL